MKLNYCEFQLTAFFLCPGTCISEIHEDEFESLQLLKSWTVSPAVQTFRINPPPPPICCLCCYSSANRITKGWGGSQLLQDHCVNLVKNITKLIFLFNWCNLVTSIILMTLLQTPMTLKPDHCLLASLCVSRRYQTWKYWWHYLNKAVTRVPFF